MALVPFKGYFCVALAQRRERKSLSVVPPSRPTWHLLTWKRSTKLETWKELKWKFSKAGTFPQMCHGQLWGNHILKGAVQSPLWPGLVGSGQSLVAPTATTPVCSCCRVPVDHSKPEATAFRTCCLRAALEIPHEHSTALAHQHQYPPFLGGSLSEFAKEAFAAHQNLLCWTCWEIPLCTLTPVPAQFADNETWLLPLCSSLDRKQMWREGYNLLQYQTPRYWAFLCAPEKTERTMKMQWKAEHLVVAVPALNFYKFMCPH